MKTKTKTEAVKAKKSERGSVVLEAALMLPIIFVLLLGILEFGRVLMIQQALTNAAREGARQGAVYMDDTEALTVAGDVASDYLTRTGVNLSMVTVTPIFEDINGSEAVQVSINYDYTSGLAVWIPGMNNHLDLNSRVVMRREA
ncbi:MAG: TadE/TadG family type IV pilus assembly protein [Candidatus Omnitrophota bacterium]|nr:TadE/TadG family type IV pilus assembly protein [Candidatus Omnitrophota bacterium]